MDTAQSIFAIFSGVLFISLAFISFTAWLNQGPILYLWMVFISSLLVTFFTFFTVFVAELDVTHFRTLDVTIAICILVFCFFLNYKFVLDIFGFKKSFTIISSLRIKDIIFRSGNNQGFVLETETGKKVKLLFRCKQFSDWYVGVSPELSKWVYDRWDDDYDTYISDTYELKILPHTGYIVSAVKVDRLK